MVFRMRVVPLYIILLFAALVPTKQLFASEPFIGEMRFFAGNFAPRGWAFCDGQLLPITQNEALFSILGTTYGGDGRTTFALPDMRGRSPLHSGNSAGPGLSSRPLGQKSGAEQNSLSVNQLPSHTHALNASTNAAISTVPNNRVLGSAKLYSEDVPNTSLNNASISQTGGSQPVNNMQPFIGLNCIIALTGIFPSRN